MSDQMLTESPPRAGLDCFREAIRHGADDAVMSWVREPEPGATKAAHRYVRVAQRLLDFVDQIEREETQP